jgi:hypothetical protein
MFRGDMAGGVVPIWIPEPPLYYSEVIAAIPPNPAIGTSLSASGSCRLNDGTWSYASVATAADTEHSETWEYANCQGRALSFLVGGDTTMAWLLFLYLHCFTGL